MPFLIFISGVFVSFLVLAAENPKVIDKASYVMSASFIFMGFTLNEWSLIVGIVLGVLTFILNTYVKIKVLKRGDK